MHQASVDSLPGLEKFFNSSSAQNGKVLRLVINVIAAIPQEKAMNLLSKISYDQSIDAGLRKAAQEALSASAARKASKFLDPDGDGVDLTRLWALGKTS